MVKKKSKRAFERQTTVKRSEHQPEYEKMKNGHLSTIQSEVADRFYKYYMGMESTGLGIDYSKPMVDGGLGNYGIPDYAIECGQKLARAFSILGVSNYQIVHKYICEGFTTEQVCIYFRDEPTDRVCRYYKRRFRDALDDLSQEWFPSHKSKRGIRISRETRAAINPAHWGKVNDA
jgi:hypothetical protein